MSWLRSTAGVSKIYKLNCCHIYAIILILYDDHEKVIATAIVFNQHSGYYAHSVEALKNGKIIYEKEL